MEVLNICDEHVCRLGPIESEVYNLKNEGEEISEFTAEFSAHFTAQLQERDEEKEANVSNAEGSVPLQTKTSSMRVPLQLYKRQDVRWFFGISRTERELQFSYCSHVTLQKHLLFIFV